MRLKWTRPLELVGIGYGYTTHQKMLRAALERAGVEITEGDAPVAVSIITGGDFKPVPGAFNVLYTMYEATSIPDAWVEPINKCDLLVVPCRHNRDLFRRHIDKRIPIEVCWEGVDPTAYNFQPRQFPEHEEKFRFLWVGASNERKGYKHAALAWHVFRTCFPQWIDKTELYMKTTQLAPKDGIVAYKNGQPVRQPMPIERVFRADNATVDTRRLPQAELAKLYKDSHAFLFPTMGEGFGLTLAEAMATGLPCIYVPWSGPNDFCDPTTGFPVQWHFVPIRALTPRDDGKLEVTHESTSASADIDSIVKQMAYIYTHYREALKRGKSASERIASRFTWDISAQSFIKIIEQYTGERLGKKEAAA